MIRETRPGGRGPNRASVLRSRARRPAWKLGPLRSRSAVRESTACRTAFKVAPTWGSRRPHDDNPRSASRRWSPRTSRWRRATYWARLTASSRWAGSTTANSCRCSSTCPATCPARARSSPPNWVRHGVAGPGREEGPESEIGAFRAGRAGGGGSPWASPNQAASNRDRAFSHLAEQASLPRGAPVVALSRLCARAGGAREARPRRSCGNPAAGGAERERRPGLPPADRHRAPRRPGRGGRPPDEGRTPAAPHGTRIGVLRPRSRSHGNGNMVRLTMLVLRRRPLLRGQ